ncbi:gamma-glutamyl-gamma-aminobutyrate hydrolase family protein [Listeria ilorinensis]|uniref:gamma-glutamyl-gamma-aminobutyrate hydrolase family protein n=1 Tax=Listeria ilorinensis TaxID=2867439 RepID=UPI001EF62789|nr:gamma-glutamyl-gamma-aminobutyrate hydrolase family protein [Listeria ilorinensis]
MKPVIGISGNRLVKGVDTFYGHRVTYTQQRYVDAIQKVGGLPLVIPIDDPASAEQAISLVDGLLLTGGQDISPHFYSQEPSPEIGVYSPPRDEFEVSLIRAAMLQDKPIFAICRGMQILNVALGGTLYQDISEVETPLVQHLQRVDEQLGSHTIDIQPNSQLARISGAKKLVNSLHHQFLRELAEPLQVTARSQDGMIEAVETPNMAPWILGVQWHPELMYGQDPESEALFNLLVEEAKKHK